MKSLVRFGTAAAIGTVFALLALVPVGTPVAQETVSFADDVMPILELRCVECHQPGGEGYETSGLDLTSYEGLMKGTKYGPIVDPGNAVMSNFMVLIEGRAAPEIQMPHHRKKLTRWEINTLRRWINTGAENN